MDEASLIFASLGLAATTEYLVGYAIECMLKALVLVRTRPLDRPPQGRETLEWMKRKFGHDLIELGRELARLGTPIPGIYELISFSLLLGIHSCVMSQAPAMSFTQSDFCLPQTDY